MSKRFANLSERLGADIPTYPPRTNDGEDVTTADHTEGNQEKEKPMADEPVSAADHASALAVATAKATQEANARYSAVLASDEYKGREALATNLLGNASMDANAIIGALAAAPRIEPAAIDAEAIAAPAEVAARDEMKVAIAETGNSDVEGIGGASSKPDAKAEIDGTWSKAYNLDEKGVK